MQQFAFRFSDAELLGIAFSRLSPRGSPPNPRLLRQSHSFIGKNTGKISDWSEQVRQFQCCLGSCADATFSCIANPPFHRNFGADVNTLGLLPQKESFALAEERKVIRDTIQEPLPILAWTRELQGYEDARTSAENALRHIWDGTDGSRAIREGNPWLNFCLYKIRAGLLRADSPEILRCVQHAQRIGKAEWFFDRVAADLKNAKKRVPGAPQFNPFRAFLATTWVRSGLWLMPDDLIARVLPMPHAGFSRQAITRAVKELGLVKHPDTARAPIVKGLGPGPVFIFREGYPPKS